VVLAVVPACAVPAIAGVALAASLAGPLRWPLAGAAPAITDGFGDPRATHFHAGLDLSTGRVTGAEVLAPADAAVERVRTSHGGYGRSLYLRAGDGRLLVFAHLDAFEPGLAAFVDSAQRASGEYEQDLWPAADRFRFRAGARVAWSGESGAGPPHLHVEVRRGDFALHPLLSGYAAPDRVPPSIARVLLEPLDERSWVERGASVVPVPVGPGEDTVLVEGRARLVVVASDATDRSSRLPVHSLVARFRDTWVECRMDSVSWAGEMEQAGWLLDRERVAASDGVILDSPSGWRPRFLSSNRPLSQAIELVRMAPGDPPRALELLACDAAGLTTSRRVWLRGPRPGEEGPRRDRSPAARAKAKRASADAAPRWNFAVLPDQRLRVRVTGVPAPLRDVRIERSRARGVPGDTATATWDGTGWCAVLHAGGVPDNEGFWFRGTTAAGAAWSNRGGFELWPAGTTLLSRVEDWATFALEPASTFEPGVALARVRPLTGVPPGAHGVRAALEVLPVHLPLAGRAKLSLALPAGLPRERVGVYRRDGAASRWSWIESEWDSVARSFRAGPSRLGQFALLRDDAPPEVLAPVAARGAGGRPYSTWSLRARVVDRASGVAARRSTLVVDGARVPTEWDAEAGVLRWRPLARPAPGRHEVRVEAFDRAGNRTVRRGVFVITSR
jgi:hypothetical protein